MRRLVLLGLLSAAWACSSDAVDRGASRAARADSAGSSAAAGPSAPLSMLTAGSSAGASAADLQQPVSVVTQAPMSTSADDCSAAAKLIYVLDQNGMLSSFRPDTLQFTDIGVLACEAASRPYSMSVDRRGFAWVVYESGKLYKVSTTDLRCETIGRAPGAGGFTSFGMSFVALEGQAGKDQLFIAGMRTLDNSFDFQAALGTIDTSSFATDRLGALDGVQPELTGTGDGKLWVFYPQSTPPRLDRLDPKTAAKLETHPLSAIQSGSPIAWAVAFWGGDFWVFLQLPTAGSTTVHRVDGKTFTSQVALADTGRSIVGAGVSTCAPLTLF